MQSRTSTIQALCVASFSRSPSDLLCPVQCQIIKENSPYFKGKLKVVATFLTLVKMYVFIFIILAVSCFGSYGISVTSFTVKTKTQDKFCKPLHTAVMNAFALLMILFFADPYQ